VVLVDVDPHISIHQEVTLSIREPVRSRLPFLDHRE